MDNLDLYGGTFTPTSITAQSELFFKIYRQVPIRDNMGFVKIVYEIPGQQKRGGMNLIYVPPHNRQSCILCINSYTTISDPNFGGPKEFKRTNVGGENNLTKFIRETLVFRPREYLFIQASQYKSGKILPGIKQAYKQNTQTEEEKLDEGKLSSVLVKPVLSEMIKRGLLEEGPNRSGTNYLRKAVINECRKDKSCSPEDEEKLANGMLHAPSSAELSYVKVTKPYAPQNTSVPPSWKIVAERESSRQAVKGRRA
jgi:hypothetical protein